MSKLPKVVLVGRMNVGKSTLFNRLSQRIKPITLDYEGVTRDFLREEVMWRDVPFELVDTGGISLKKVGDPIMEKVRQHALKVLKEADLVLFMIDGSIGLIPSEFELAKELHKMEKPIVLVVNKTDVKSWMEHQGEFERLGFSNIAPISAMHNRGIDELLNQIIKLLPRIKMVRDQERLCRVTLLGRPNVGKSSLLNALLKEERAIVTDIPGTTREALSAKVKFHAQTIELVDTAGVRRKKTIKEPLEALMVRSSMQAVRETDIVLLVVDASEGRLTDQELKLAFYTFEQGKALIILINKSDLLDDYLQERWCFHEEEYQYFYNKIEMLQISCKTEKNVGKVLSLVDKVWQRYMIEFSQEELTALFKKSFVDRHFYKQEQQLSIVKAEQINVGPPTISLKAKHQKFFGERETSYLDKVLRSHYDLKSVPIKFVFKPK